jgi:DNA-binding transcriptional MerR regulator
MRQLDLFGFIEEEKPAKKQEIPFIANNGPDEQIPVNTPGRAPVNNEIEQVNGQEDVTENDSVSINDEDRIIVVNETFFTKPQDGPANTAVERTAAKGKRGRKSFKDIDAEIALVEVPEDGELFQKMYYPISQVAKWFNVNTSLLRFWENEFDILKPRKNRKGDRMFRPEDIKNLQVIYYLLRQRKFSIEGAKKYIKQNKSRAEVNIQLIQSLTKFRSFLLEMKANLGA